MSNSNQHQDPTYVFKYVIVGDRNVGKSCIIQRFAYNDNVRNRYCQQLTFFITQKKYRNLSWNI